MEQRLLDRQIPPCMIGTWAWGSGINGSKMIFGNRYDEQELIETFRQACDAGFTMWDTAEVYGKGNSERILAKCKQERPDILISTKHFPGKRFREGAMEKSLEGSCKRLETEIPDLYWIHVPNQLPKNVWEGIKLLKQGRIKALGISNANLEQIQQTCRQMQSEGVRLAAVQNHFSLLSGGRQQEEIIAYCREQGIVYFSYMVLEQGALSGRYDGKHGFSGISLRRLTFTKRKLSKIEPLLAYQKELAEQYQVGTAQIPVAWAIAKGTVPIIGLTRPKYVVDLAKAVTVSLQESELQKLESLAQESGVYIKGVWEP